jgi:hypothetical protein
LLLQVLGLQLTRRVVPMPRRGIRELGHIRMRRIVCGGHASRFASVDVT